MIETIRRSIPKRRILFIEKAFQFRFIAKMTALVVAGTALTGGLLYLLADQEFGRAFYSAHYQARSSWELLLPAVLVSSFASMGVVAALAVVLTLYDSHRIGGPLYRFRVNLKAVGEGDLTLVTRLREGDELQPLTEAMNDMTRGLREKLLAVHEAARELEDWADGLAGVDEADRTRAAKACEGLRRALGAFRFEP
ncbi:MAG: methyl-accepting chemotaxis protein [Thermodesulfobacteriota bacterium]